MDIVIAELEDITRAQITNAKGLSHFFMRDETTKQFKQVTDPAMIEVALNAGDEGSYYWIHTKDPSTQAFTALTDRALDRPTERKELTGAHGGPMVLKWDE